MRGLLVVAVGVLCACSATAPGDSPVIPNLEVTERSATTLSLRWDAMDTASTYSVDVLTGIARCTDFPTHNTTLVIKGTTTQLTGLAPATRYHVHVHALPLLTPSTNRLTNTVFVMTLLAGVPAQPVTAADYERCSVGQ